LLSNALWLQHGHFKIAMLQIKSRIPSNIAYHAVFWPEISVGPLYMLSTSIVTKLMSIRKNMRTRTNTAVSPAYAVTIAHLYDQRAVLALAGATASADEALMQGQPKRNTGVRQPWKLVTHPPA
jgi:hypothetical protein